MSAKDRANGLRNVELVQDPQIDLCIALLLAMEFDAVSALQALKDDKEANSRSIDPNSLIPNVVEHHVGRMLNEISQKTQGVKFSPIPHEAITETYLFRYKKGTLLANYPNDATRRTEPVVEYDAVTTITDSEGNVLPVVWEVKYPVSSNFETVSRKLNKALTSDRVNRVAAPLTEFFNTHRMGYVVVTSSFALHVKTPEQTQFESMGGKIVSLSIDTAPLMRP